MNQESQQAGKGERAEVVRMRFLILTNGFIPKWSHYPGSFTLAVHLPPKEASTGCQTFD
jgi:hypothetical protein